MPEGDPVVVVADDECGLADLYTAWLPNRYTTHTVYDGPEVLDALDALDGGVDVVLLDRRMPSLSGDEVLNAIHDRGYRCRVAMLSAVDPDFDLLELACDAYLTKPVSQDQLCDLVSALLRRDRLDPAAAELCSLRSKRAVLDAEVPASKLADSDRYQALLDRIETAEADAPSRTHDPTVPTDERLWPRTDHVDG